MNQINIKNVDSILNSKINIYTLSLLFSIFSFWITLKNLEPLWPGQRARPMSLPMLWLFLSAINIGLMIWIKSRFEFKKLDWLYIIVLIILPIVLGALAMQLQIYLIGFELAE